MGLHVAQQEFDRCVTHYAGDDDARDRQRPPGPQANLLLPDPEASWRPHRRSAASKDKRKTAPRASRFTPRKRAAVIVTPERETPGTSASAWAKPTVIASAEVIWSQSLLPAPGLFRHDKHQRQQNERRRNDARIPKAGFHEVLQQTGRRCRRESSPGSHTTPAGRSAFRECSRRPIRPARSSPGGSRSAAPPACPGGVQRRNSGWWKGRSSPETTERDRGARSTRSAETRSALNGAENDRLKDVHISMITGRMNGRFAVCLKKYFFRSLRIFSLMTE